MLAVESPGRSDFTAGGKRDVMFVEGAHCARLLDTGVTVCQNCRMMIEQPDAAPVKRAADRPEQIVKVVPQRQIVPAEMRSENDGAVHSRFGGGIGAPFDGVCDIVIGPLQVFPCEPPADGSDFLSRIHLISCIPVLYFARMPRDSSSDIKHDRAVFSQIQRETRFRFRNFRNLPAG